MTIGKRLVNLVRSNLNSVIHRASDVDWLGRGDHRKLEELTDEELEEEIRRRRLRREAAERAAHRTVEQEAWEEVEGSLGDETGRYRTTGGARRTGSYRRAGASTAGPAAGRRPQSATGAAHDPRLAQLYAQLECPYGADMTTVRKHYRKLMLKYHPDKHSGNPDKQRLATDLSQRLTMAYNDLRRHLSGSQP